LVTKSLRAFRCGIDEAATAKAHGGSVPAGSQAARMQAAAARHSAKGGGGGKK
jgi:hypothetical protein